MRRAEGTDVRNYCSESTCNIVETGVNLLVFYSCKICKRECSESLKDRVENKITDQIELDLETAYHGWGSWPP